MTSGGQTSIMLPYEPLGVYDAAPPPPTQPSHHHHHKTFSRFLFKMPRVVADQKSKFESEELFRRHSRESEVRYTAYRDRPLEERQMRFHNSCREGHVEVAFTTSGTNIQLVFSPCSNGFGSNGEIDFEKEHGKVHIRAPLIMNGVCIRWRGWVDVERLDGVGCLEYDDERAQVEDAILRDQLERYNQRLREFEEKQRAYRAQHERRTEADAKVRAEKA